MPRDDHVTSARAVYDVSAKRYIEFVGTELSPAIEGPVDRSLLLAFVERVATGLGGKVADVGMRARSGGCLPGRAGP